jgi:hypothetical protein
MSAAASNRPAFTGELITINDREYFFSIKDRKLTAIDDYSTLEESDYPEEIRNELRDYFNHRYPVLVEKEEEEDLEEESEDKKLFLPKVLKRRMVVDYIIENKKQREHFTSLNITNGSILFQEQMTSFLVKIAEEYISEKNPTMKEKNDFITKWKKKGDICQSFVKKTASALTKETIEEALAIFEESKSLLNDLTNESFKKEALDIFKLQFFAFENGAYLYNGAHGEMVAYNAIQELLYKSKTGEIKSKEQINKINVNEFDLQSYEERRKQKQEYARKKEEEEKRKAKERFDNTDEDFTLITGYNYKYRDNKTGKEYPAKHNDILITIDEIKGFVETKKLKKGFMVLTLNKNNEIVDKNKIYEKNEIPGEDSTRILLEVKNLETYEIKSINEYLLNTFGMFRERPNVSMNNKGQIWLKKTERNKEIIEKNLNQIIEFFKQKDIYSKEEVYDIDSETEAIFNIEIPKKEKPKKSSKKEEVKTKVEKLYNKEDITTKDGKSMIKITLSHSGEDQLKIQEELNKVFGTWDNGNPKQKITKGNIWVQQNNYTKMNINKIEKVLDKYNKVTKVMEKQEEPKKEEVKVTKEEPVVIKEETKTPILKDYPNYELLMRNEKDFWKEMPEDYELKLDEQKGITIDFLNWVETIEEVALQVNNEKAAIVDFEMETKMIEGHKNRVFVMKGTSAGVVFPLEELIKIYQYTKVYKTSNQEIIKGKKIKIRGIEGDIENEVSFKTLAHPNNREQKEEGWRKP